MPCQQLTNVYTATFKLVMDGIPLVVIVHDLREDNELRETVLMSEMIDLEFGFYV